MRRTRGRILGLVVVSLVFIVAVDLCRHSPDRMGFFSDSTSLGRTPPASSPRLAENNVHKAQHHPVHRGDQERAHRVRHNVETSYDNRTGLSDFWGFVNRTYVEEHMSFPTVGQHKCQDVLCSEFLSRDDWIYFNACGPRNKHKPTNFLPNCHFINGSSRPTVALLSFQGSGNTWTRQLLEKATGICTGSLYCDKSIWSSGMVGEYLRGSSVVAVKTHMRTWRTEPVQYGAMILIIRNPFDAIVSYWKWMLWYRNATKVENGHLGNLPPEYFQNYGLWDKFVNNQILFWHDIIAKKMMEFKQLGHPVLVVRYEDLRKNHTKEVIRMLDFLQVTYQPQDVEQRLQEDLTKFKRTKPPLQFDPYTTKQRELVNSILRTTVSDLAVQKSKNSFGIEDYYSIT